jgi:hypothetical protein
MHSRAETTVPAGGREHWIDPAAFFHRGTSGQWHDLLNHADLARYAARVRIPDSSGLSFVDRLRGGDDLVGDGAVGSMCRTPPRGWTGRVSSAVDEDGAGAGHTVIRVARFDVHPFLVHREVGVMCPLTS